MQAKITKRLVDQLTPGAKDELVWDLALKGFGLKITPKGVKTYLLQYRMGGRGAPTKKFTIGRHGSPWTPDAARSEAERLLALVRQGTDPAEEKRRRAAEAVTVSELADRYLSDHVAPKNKPSTAKEARRLVERIIKPKLGAMAVGLVARSDIATLHHRHRNTPRQANHVLSVLGKMFSLAEVWGLRPDGSNPCRLIQRYRENKRERFLSEAEVADLAEALAELGDNRREMDGVLNAVRLLLLTGLRLGEVLSLQWGDVDLDRGTLDIRAAKAGARVHPIGALAAAFLRALPRDGLWVVTGRDPARPLSRNTLEGAWTRIRVKASEVSQKRAKETGNPDAASDLTDVRLHDLRHTVGTYAGQTGANAFLVRDKLGHKTLAMTGRYVNRDADPLRALSDAVESRIVAALEVGTGRRKAAEVVALPAGARRKR